MILVAGNAFRRRRGSRPPEARSRSRRGNRHLRRRLPGHRYLSTRPSRRSRSIGFARSGNGQLHRLGGSPSLAGKLHGRKIAELAADPRVLSISPDRLVRGNMDASRCPRSGRTGSATTSGFTGKGITVALIDSGLTPNGAVPTTSGCWPASISPARAATAMDRFGHGTHIAGIIGGSGDKGTCTGVAPGVNFVSLRVLNDQGAGYASGVIEAIEWAIANRARLRHPHPQHVAGPPGDGVLPHRPALPRGGAGLGRRPARRGLRGQPRPRRLHDDQHAGEQPVRAHRRRDERPRTPSRARTTSRPPTPAAVPPWATTWSSRTWSPPATASSPRWPPAPRWPSSTPTQVSTATRSSFPAPAWPPGPFPAPRR